MLKDFALLALGSLLPGNRRPSKIPFVYIDLAAGCNSRCLTCDIWKNSTQGELSFEQWKEVIAQLPSLGTKLVSIGGGEPTLRRDLEDIVREAAARGLKVHINTHLATVSQSRLRSLFEAGVKAFHVSLDAHERESYKRIRGIDRFEQVKENIRFLLKETNSFVGINFVVSRLNQDSIADIARFCEQEGAHKLQFIPVSGNLQQKNMPLETFKDLIPKLEDLRHIKLQLKSAAQSLSQKGIMSSSAPYLESFEMAYVSKRLFPCFAGKAFLTIDARGEVFPCHEHSSKLNIKNLSLKEIIQTQDYQHALAKVRSCEAACHDPGSAEVNIRLNPRYLPWTLKNLFKEIKSYLS